ncbi:DUF2188 domain-containing protein [Halomonas glaciei]|uniref:DUF2188 domain-containing protein n=1 Tax=Vreelandella glaciei TaxID=186761 RepID=A0A7Z0LX00_9GAMM|nr:DUF2188 domain-containing protein [Halomonas glaciei]NYS80124.1 DUF2188 domain-containing protein [Halomonas glaciei]
MDKYDISKDDKGWRFGKEGSDRALRRADTKADATDKMRDYMKDKEGSVKIRKQDGTYQEERTYPRSSDPRRTKG